MKFLLAFLFLLSFSLSTAQPTDPIFIGHRGGFLPGIPENSLMAFQHCIAEHVAMIETDIQLTKDKQMVLFHDKSLLRMTGVNGKLSEYTLAELQQMDLGYNQYIPTLEEALIILQSGTINLLLDIKAGDDLDYTTLYTLLEYYQMTSRVFIGVRSLKDLKTCKTLNTHIKVLGFVPGPEYIDTFITSQADAIRIWPNYLKEQPDLISEVLQQHIPVWMTVGAMPNQEIMLWADQGVTGFIHDTPKAAELAFKH
ncbi:glycerophosphodiester phosphodiesterase family protein [Formosa sp. PL04]|uniref:glycerophosphodiester phosphodiesterase n=1 Tax=Formosa sp. PL04 TaxID=3081755 RepID=UPI002981EEFB|nr:glycerophosphodiester phosphodiesterase family protein [Formosa sp. PL04]MDW5288554.1 glycerophosphodiester phosphodiesterase family protein [Formosa sp. PL04]